MMSIKMVVAISVWGVIAMIGWAMYLCSMLPSSRPKP